MYCELLCVEDYGEGLGETGEEVFGGEKLREAKRRAWNALIPFVTRLHEERSDEHSEHFELTPLANDPRYARRRI